MRFNKPHTGGYKLPELNNPAGSNQIAAGFDAINNNGFVVTGVHECEGGVILPELTNPAGPDDIEKGKEAVDENGNIITGTHECETLEDMTADGTAVPEDIAKGETAYVKGVKITGTHECESLEMMEVDDDMIDLTGYTFVKSVELLEEKGDSFNLSASKEYLFLVSYVAKRPLYSSAAAVLDDLGGLGFKASFNGGTLSDVAFIPHGKMIAIKMKGVTNIAGDEKVREDSDGNDIVYGLSVAVYVKS